MDNPHAAQAAMTPEEHSQSLADLVAAIPAIEAELAANRDRLEEILREAGPLDCVAQASATYLIHHAETFQESTNDRSPAHLEFMALAALPILREANTLEGEDGGVLPGNTAANPQQLFQATGESIGLVRECFHATSHLIWMRTIETDVENGEESGYEEFRREALLESLGIRGTAYDEHSELILIGCLEPFDVECRDLLGFTAREAWACSTAVGEILSERIGLRLHEVGVRYKDAAKDLARLRRKKKLPAELAKLAPSAQKAFLLQNLEARAFFDALDLVTLTPADISGRTDLDEPAVTAWFDALTCDPDLYDERFHREPCGAHPVTRFPILAVPGGYIAPAATSLSEALRPIMEDALHTQGGRIWSRYESHRAVWVETVAAERIADVLPGSASWTAIAWSSPTDSSDLDGLVHCDDFSLRVQCKSGRISDPARRGAPSMTEDIGLVIKDAAHQHDRLAKALATHEAVDLGFTPAQANALASPLSVDVIVCLDDVTVWSTETHKLRHLVAMPDGPYVPWVLSLADLLAVTDLLQSVEFAHYVTRRLRLEAEERVEAHDELDWVGNYITAGLFFDMHFESPDAPDMLRLTSFTDPIDRWYFSRAGLLDSPVPRPQQQLPAGLRKFIGRLQRDQPPHWLTASLLLLNGDDQSRDGFAASLEHTQMRAAEVGWSSVTQIFDADYSVTLTVDLKHHGSDLRARLHSYWEDKIKEHGCPNAVSLGLGSDGKLVVDVVQTDPTHTISHVLLSRVSRTPAEAPE